MMREPMSRRQLDLLTAALVEVVLATPGVRRLEPTMLGALKQLGVASVAAPRSLARPAAPRVDTAEPDGIAVATHRTGEGEEEVDVTVDVVLEGRSTARVVAEEVQRRIAERVAEQANVGSVAVSVLATEPAGADRTAGPS